ncbi:hypothetical protein C8R43DRAFT_1118950 [Mycena crocata]|nr:hypothetical protein C8R43DRAFT_1118950 [Mycena crocata]
MGGRAWMKIHHSRGTASAGGMQLSTALYSFGQRKRAGIEYHMDEVHHSRWTASASGMQILTAAEPSIITSMKIYHSRGTASAGGKQLSTALYSFGQRKRAGIEYHMDEVHHSRWTLSAGGMQILTPCAHNQASGKPSPTDLTLHQWINKIFAQSMARKQFSVIVDHHIRAYKRGDVEGRFAVVLQRLVSQCRNSPNSANADWTFTSARNIRGASTYVGGAIVRLADESKQGSEGHLRVSFESQPRRQPRRPRTRCHYKNEIIAQFSGQMMEAFEGSAFSDCGSLSTVDTVVDISFAAGREEQEPGSSVFGASSIDTKDDIPAPASNRGFLAAGRSSSRSSPSSSIQCRKPNDDLLRFALPFGRTSSSRAKRRRLLPSLPQTKLWTPEDAAGTVDEVI